MVHVWASYLITKHRISTWEIYLESGTETITISSGGAMYFAKNRFVSKQEFWEAMS